MAYLPTVNEMDSSLTKEEKKDIAESLKKRFGGFNISTTFIRSMEDNKSKDKIQKDKNDGSDVLNKLYEFIVRDSYNKSFDRKKLESEEEKEDDIQTEQQIQLLQKVEEEKEEPEEEKEGLLGKLWRYFKYFSMGRFVYNHWEQIEKLLGIEGLGKTIKNLSDELGITEAIQGIISTLDDISTSFSETVKPYLPDFGGDDTVYDAGKPIDVGGLTMPSEQVASAIDKAAAATGVDKASLYAIARQESGFKSNAGAGTSSAKGLFQITKGTWAGLQEKYPELRGKSIYDPEANALAGALYMKETQKELGTKDLTKTYAGHFFGPAGARRFYRADDSDIAANVLPEAAQANRNVFYDKKTGQARTVGEVKQFMYNKVGKYQSAYQERLTGNKTPLEAPPITPETKIDPAQAAIKNEIPDTSIKEPRSLAFKPAEEKALLETPAPKQDVLKSALSGEPDSYRIPRNTKTSDKGETGVNSTTAEVKSANDNDIATESDLKNLRFLHPDQTGILKVLAKKVQKLREELGVSNFIINSGYRSPAYNEALRKAGHGAAKDSYHTHRMAVDINVAQWGTSDRVKFIRTASRLGFGGIGAYKTFIHVDIGKRRTWKTDYTPPEDIAAALRDHINQTTPQEKYDIPSRIEVEKGEGGVNSQGGKFPESTDIDEGKSEESMDFLDMAMDMFEKQKVLLGNLVDKTNNMMKSGKLEEMVAPYLNKNTEIPRKEKKDPNLQMPSLHTNNVQTNVQQNKYSVVDRSFTNDDPSIFSNPFSYINDE